MAGPISITKTYTDITGMRKNIDNFHRAHWVAMKRLWKNATKEFIRSALFGTNSVHILTGMSAASFIPLARQAGIARTVESYVIAKSKGAKKGLTLMSGDYSKSRWKGIQEGQKAGSDSKILYGSEKRPHMVMIFSINVYQYAYWEPLWRTMDSALATFHNFIKENHDKYFPEEALKKAIIPRTRIYHV
jgi:hypothetical protein